MAVNRACNVFLERKRGWSTRMKCGGTFSVRVEEKKNQANLEFSGENKAMQRKNEVHYFLGR